MFLGLKQMYLLRLISEERGERPKFLATASGILPQPNLLLIEPFLNPTLLAFLFYFSIVLFT